MVPYASMKEIGFMGRTLLPFCALLFLLVLPWGCTDVTENFPEGGCAPDSLQCVGKDLARCRTDGSDWEIFKVCADDSPCAGNPPTCEAAPTGVACSSDTQCIGQLGDVGACRRAVCDGGICRTAAVADETVCDDGSSCTGNEKCTDGQCVGKIVSCDDDNPCTQDSCDPATGCNYSNVDGSQCSDGDACTWSDTCAGGQCGGIAVVCDDGNVCTNDFCDTAKGECVYEALSGSCDDGDACTDGDECSAGECVGKDLKCGCTTVDDCPGEGPTNPCLGKYACENSFCVVDAASKVVCEQDGLGPCEASVCQPDNGLATCVPVADATGTPCDDLSDCTTGDLCQAGACVGILDITKPGCGVFQLKWWSLTANQPSTGASAEGVQYRVRVSYPHIIGNGQNAIYKVQAIGPGYGEGTK